MIGKVFLGAVLVAGLSASAQAAMMRAPPPASESVVKVAEGCGPGF